jgi:hypothetical protein
MTDYVALRTPLLAPVRELFRASQGNITIVSPYPNVFGLNVLREALQERARKACQVTILTSVSVRSIGDGSLDLESLLVYRQF